MKKSYAGMKDYPNYVQHCPYIMALVPFYDDEGRDSTRIHYFGGAEETYPYCCEQILEELAVVFRTSMEVLRGRARKEFEAEKPRTMRKIPVVLIKGLCFVPLKCREIRDKNDSTLGYVVHQYVDRIEQLSVSECRIWFKDDELSLLFQQQRRTVKYQMKLAERLQKQLEAEDQFWRYEMSIACRRLNKRIQEKKQKQLHETEQNQRANGEGGLR